MHHLGRKITGGALSSALAATLYARFQYPAKGEALEGGSMVTANGKQYHVVGHFGAPDRTFRNGLDSERALYYASLATAQSYALSRSQRGDTPLTGVVVSERPVLLTDHMPGEFEGYDPISPAGQKRAGVQILHVEEVTLENRRGSVGSLMRFWKDIQANLQTQRSLGTWSPKRHLHRAINARTKL